LISINSPQSALEALDHDDAGIRYHGAWWLGKHRAEEAVPKLMECLNDEKDRTSAGGYPLRRQAARSLGLIRDSKCTPALIKTLETEDVQLHEATLRALIEIEDHRCLDSLFTYLDKEIEGKPVEALIEALTAYKAWTIREKIRPYLESDSERVASSAASFFFCCTGETTYLNTIINLLDHNNRFVRQSAAFDLARIASRETARPIINAKIPNNIKMFAIKSILNTSIQRKEASREEDHSAEQQGLRAELFEELDNLVRENFSGNLLIDRKDGALNDLASHTATVGGEGLHKIYAKLRSPSLADRQDGIQQLVKTSINHQPDLLELYFSESDQDIKMGLIKAMANLKRKAYLPALLDAIGVEVGNHCQGNIRRVATCALGCIRWQDDSDSESLSNVLNKLRWIIGNPEDWGLRYSACLALEAIRTFPATEILTSAKSNEADLVVSTRISMALSEIRSCP
jgi:phycocyanobilin lyase alpha subunit